MATISYGRAITRLAESDPDRPAVTCEGASVSRRELDLRTNRLARAYEALGIRQGDLVTIALPNGIEFYEAAVATWKLGATPQPVSWRLPQREREAIVELADARLVVGADAAAHPNRQVVPAGFEPDASLGDGELPDRVAPTWKAPTSGGSTGRPKLILSGDPGVLDPDGVPALLTGRDGCHVVPGPLYHNAPFTSSMQGLLNGNHIVVLPKFDAEATLRAIHDHGATFVLLVPTMMLRIWRLPEDVKARYDLSSLQVVWHMAAPCPAWLKEAWVDWIGGERIWELYAGTEAQAISIIRGDEWMSHKGSVGRVAVGEMKVVSADGEDLPPGEVGEIYLRTSAAGSPTYRYVGADARTIGDHWESLGDLGYFDTDGYLFLTDRLADMILTGGANVYPAEVESALMEHPHVQTCAVIGLPDEDLGNRVHAVVQTDGEVSEDELRAFLADRLVRYKIPRTFELVDWLVRDDAGKVRRSALRAERAEQAERALHADREASGPESERAEPASSEPVP
jgi:bile acid-coenzyme A ligase